MNATTSLARDTALLAGLLGLSGVVHLVKPELYEPLMPARLPARREIIVVSGVAELACAVGLAVPATRRPAGWASAALLIAVFPGNVTLATKARRSSSTTFKILTWGRLPLQVPMIRAALKPTRS